MPTLRLVDARFERVQKIFQCAIDLPAAQRQAFVERETQDDLAVREEVLSLLEHDLVAATGPLSRAIGEALEKTDIERRQAMIGQVVGNYRLAAVLGQGGAGTVYLGERADQQYSAQVAVKIVDHAAVQGSLGTRFRAERQILASLNHPNIARLIDAGETPEGRPYLVMEYVNGLTLDRYCDEQRLDLRARLKLFVDICATVQYAHQNLVVHRDLKPGNVLVTAEATPKLLDFGIAKLLDAGDVAQTADLTRFNDRLLTPEYASPEQILGRAVTTASDVYSLGVMLYQLLTGLRPYHVPATISQLELERTICVVDPARPSAAVARFAVNGSKAGLSDINAVAAARACTPDRLRRQLHGDLDAIVKRALRKEPEHRYSSVEQLALDIERYLANKAVHARQGNWLYHGQRFVRRHKVGAIMSTGLVLFIAGVAIVMSIQRQNLSVALQRESQERQRAENISEFMLNVFTSVDPFVNFGAEPSARDLLDQASRRIETDLGELPEVRAAQRETIGRAYRRLGLPERAVPHLVDSLRIQRRLQQSDATHTSSVVVETAIALREAGRFDESDHYFNDALKSLQLASNKQSVEYAKLLVELGRLENLRSHNTQSHDYFAQALELMRRIKGSRHPEVGSILSELANTLVWADDLDGAEKMAREAVDIYSAVNELHPDRVKADYHLAEILLYQGRIKQAAPIFERALAAQRLLYGSNSIVADTLASLAQVRAAQNKPVEAEALVREALAAHRDSGSTAYHKIGYLQTMLATILMKQQKFAEAERFLREALGLLARDLTPDHQYVASAEHYLGETLLATGKLAEAATVLTAATSRWSRTDAPAWRAARSASSLGEALYKQGRFTEAERYLVESYRTLRADDGADQETKNKALRRVTRFYKERGKPRELDALLGEAAP